MSVRHNSFYGDAYGGFIGNVFNARGPFSVFPVVCGMRTTNWAGTTGDPKSVWNRVEGAQWAWDSGVAIFGTDSVLSDSAGNVYAAGSSSTAWKADANDTPGPGTPADLWKLDPSGTVLWAVQVSAHGILHIQLSGGTLYAFDLGSPLTVYAIDPADGSVLDSVTAGGSPGSDDQLLYDGGYVYVNGRKYSFADGALQWSLSGAVGAAIATTGGALYACGPRVTQHRLTVAGEDPEDPVEVTHSVMRLTSAGGVVWTYDTGAGCTALGAGAGRVVVGGARASNKTLWALDTSGSLQWAWDGPVSPLQVHVDASGNVHVVGYRTTAWDADAADTPGPGTAASYWMLNPSGTVVATFDGGSSGFFGAVLKGVWA